MAAPQKGQPFSIRLTKEVDIYVDEEARRTDRSKSAVVEDLTVEAAKARRFPGIVFQGDWPDREPVITETGFDVWQLCETLDNYGSIAKVVADFPLVTELHCRLARAWASRHREHAGLVIVWSLRNNDFASIVDGVRLLCDARPRQRDWKSLVLTL